MKEQGWTKDGRRKGLLYGKCKKAHTIFELDHKTYCYGWIDLSDDEPLEICRDCMFNVRNME